MNANGGWQRGAQVVHALPEQSAVVGVEGRLPDAGCQAGQADAADHQFIVNHGELVHRGVGGGLAFA